jgi:hypothetical protein
MFHCSYIEVMGRLRSLDPPKEGRDTPFHKRRGVIFPELLTYTNGGTMTESIPVNLLERWISELQSILKAEITEGKTDLTLNQGMRHGIDQIQARLNTWLCHQENMKTLSRSGKECLIVKDVNLSKGRYRKLEWYENDQFITLAWRHGRNEKEGELALELQNARDLSKIFLVYKGGSSFKDLAELAREGGLAPIRNEENQGQWMEKVW